MKHELSTVEVPHAEDPLSTLLLSSTAHLYRMEMEANSLMVTWLAPSTRRILGIALASPLPEAGRQWTERIDTAYQARNLDVQRQRSRGDAVSWEYRYRHPERGLIWLRCEDLFHVPVGDARVSIVAKLTDITAERQTSESLRLSEAKHRALVEELAVGVVIHQGWKPLFINAALAKLYGYDGPEEILAGGTIKHLFAPTEVERMMKFRALRLAGKAAPTRFKVQGVRKDGGTIWTENAVRLIDTEDGTAILCIVQDITAKKTAADDLSKAKADLENRVADQTRELADSAARYKGLIDESLQGIYLHDNMRPVFANQAMADMLGLDGPDQFLAFDTILRMYPVSEHPLLIDYKNRRLRGAPAPTQYVSRAVRGDGSLIWIEQRVSIMMWSTMRVVQVACIDISARKKAEQQLIDAKADAEQANRTKIGFPRQDEP